MLTLDFGLPVWLELVDFLSREGEGWAVGAALKEKGNTASSL
jgi:hypothetical protein